MLWSGSACSWLLQQLWCSASKLGWSTSSEAPNIGQLLDSSTPSTTRTSTTGPPLRPSLRVTLSVSCDRLPLFRSFLELRERERERESSVRREIGVTENICVAVFRFPTGYHTVEQVTEASYQDCNTANPIARWVTGNDTVPLETPGTLYFICSISTHCASRGQKVMITVKSTATPSSSPNAGTHSSSLPAPPAAMASGALFVAACISLLW